MILCDIYNEKGIVVGGNLIHIVRLLSLIGDVHDVRT